MKARGFPAGRRSGIASKGSERFHFIVDFSPLLSITRHV